MHLREACIDLDGQIAAPGRIDYPPDAASHFPLPKHSRVRIRMFGQTLRLAAATAQRDERTQFLISSEAGPVVFVPQSLTTIIQRALRSSLPSPVEAWLGDQQETLESSGNREIAKTQPLSD